MDAKVSKRNNNTFKRGAALAAALRRRHATFTVPRNKSIQVCCSKGLSDPIHTVSVPFIRNPGMLVAS